MLGQLCVKKETFWIAVSNCKFFFQPWPQLSSNFNPNHGPILSFDLEDMLSKSDRACDLGVPARERLLLSEITLNE